MTESLLLTDERHLQYLFSDLYIRRRQRTRDGHGLSLFINEQNETIQLTIFWLTRLAIFLLSSLSEALSIPHELSGQYSNPTISVGVATRIDQLVIELTI